METTVFLTNVESEHSDFYSQPTKSVFSRVSSHRFRSNQKNLIITSEQQVLESGLETPMMQQKN
jgi:UDP-N-acetylmuramate-alanine ligase